MLNPNQKILYYENIIDALLREYLLKRQRLSLQDRLHLVDTIMKTEERIRTLYSIQQLIFQKKTGQK